MENIGDGEANASEPKENVGDGGAKEPEPKENISEGEAKESEQGKVVDINAIPELRSIWLFK